jgi:peptidoglycan/xylan/chitin deacetylase (PgdA/CDA1 family)
MTKKIKLILALVIFITFTYISVLYIIQNSNQSQITIEEESGKNGDQIKTPTSPEIQETEIVEESFNWEPLLNKYHSKEISKISTKEKIITLTFDGGGNADGAEKILEILKQNEIEATFFLTGKFIKKYPEVAKKIDSGGHEIGNHSYSHPYFTKLNEEEMEKEISQNQGLLKDLNIDQKALLRLPYGDRNSFVLNFVSENRYINIRWTIDSLGWQGSAGNMDSEKVQKRVVSMTTPGTIIMMHLGSDADKINLDSEALQAVIDELKKDGYEFLPLSELLKEDK